MKVSEPIGERQHADSLYISAAYTEARRRVLRQLMEALLYEDMIERLPGPPDHMPRELELPGVDDQGKPVHYLLEARTTDSFGRVRLSGQPVRRRTADGSLKEADDAALLLEELCTSFREEPRYLTTFVSEVEQTLLKEAASRHYRKQHPLLGKRSFELLEGDVLEAHPYHPCFKSRIGFNMADNEAYGPEFHPRFRLIWLAVRREDVCEASGPGSSWQEKVALELGDDTFASFTRSLLLLGVHPEDYVFIPVHPWQFREQTIRLYFRFMEDRRIVVLGEAGDEYAPQQSIRTLSNMTAPGKSNVKVALSIRNTSAIRILGTHHITNAPILSGWLASLVENDDVLRRQLRFVVLKEEAGVSFRYEAFPEPLRESAYGTLGAILRENVTVCLESGESAAPITVLTACNGDKPLIEEWIVGMGMEKWLRKLLAVCIHPLVHLLLVHGVALEAHGQNLVLIHRNGVPERLAARDVPGGVRFYKREGKERDMLRGLRDSDPLHPNSYSTSPMETENVEKIRNFLMDSFFQIMLAELAFFMEKNYGLPERRFWQLAAEEVKRCEGLLPLPEPSRYNLFAETIEVGQLTRRRLFGEQVIRNHAVRNPLHQALSEAKQEEDLP